MSNKAAILKQVKTPFVLEEIQIPQVGPSDLLIKNRAIALNPADWKMQDEGVFVESYPVILGSDVAGTVETVGSSVKGFKAGDRVSAFGDILTSKDPRNGAFQQYTVAKEAGVTKLPESLSFEEGATLPMQVATAGMGIFNDLALPRPPAKQQGGFLVWGASSSVGSGAVQIASRLGFKVYAVCSPRHHDYVQKLGAFACFDYNDEAVVQNIISSAESSQQKINLGYDAISENGSSPSAAKILEAFGGGSLVIVIPYPDVPKPKTVKIIHTFAARFFLDLSEQGLWLFGQWLPQALTDGSFVPSPPIRKVDGGLNGIENGLDILRKGISGQKVVLSL